MKFKKSLVLLLIIFFFGGIPLFAFHQKNQEIFAEVIEDYLQRNEGTDEIYLQIGQIGKEILRRGFNLSAYTYREHSETHELCFTAVPIWEGGDRVPITFFLYIWPSKDEAAKRPILGGYWASNIHSHPIECAFTVVQRQITQYQFQQASNRSDKIVQKIDRQVFTKGEQEVDLNGSPFIHQMAFEGEGKQPAITLHAYGCTTAKGVRKIFADTGEECAYSEPPHG